MKTLLAIAISMLLLACTVQTNNSFPCGNVKGVMCMQIYQPVCANNRTYSNSCVACKDSSVTTYAKGACIGDQTPEFTLCPDTNRPQVCTTEYNPVCGQVDNGIRCIRAPCPSTDNRTYANGCVACSNPKVYGYWQGECVTQKLPA
jgi:hypothetical protein